MSDYQEAVKAARQAVESMEDGKLKEVAFAQVLNYILSSGELKISRPKRSGAKGDAAEALVGRGPSPAAWFFI